MWKNISYTKQSPLHELNVDPTTTELINNFNLALSWFKSEGVDDKIFQICFKYKTSVDELKPKGELAFVLIRGLKDRHWKEITKKTCINYSPHEGFTFQNIFDQGMIKHLFDFEIEYITFFIGIRRMD